MTIKEGFVLFTVSSGLGRGGGGRGWWGTRSCMTFLMLCCLQVQIWYLECSQHCDSNFVFVQMSVFFCNLYRLERNAFCKSFFTSGLYFMYFIYNWGRNTQEFLLEFEWHCCPAQEQHVILGPGLRREGEKVVVTKPGVLRTKTPAVFWVGKFASAFCI